MTKQYRLHIALLSCLAVMVGMIGVSFAAHPNVTLRDASGPIAVGSGAAYSPKATCGGCHDYASIEQHSYHAQIGANQWMGWNNFNPNSASSFKRGVAAKGKSWVQSPGHLGKW